MVLVLQAINQRVKTAFEDIGQVIQGQPVHSVVGDPALGIVVGADALAAVTAADLQLARLCRGRRASRGFSIGQHRGQVKVWPGFDALTRALQDAGHTVVMCPPPAEVEQARRNAPTATLLPPLPLGAFAALTRRAALVVCNDSGVSHVAAAVGARQLTLFGVTRPEDTGPWSPNATCLGTAGLWPGVDAVLTQTLALLAVPQTPR